MEWMKNIVVNLQAKGPATVMIALIAGITILGLFGESVLASSALGLLSALTGLIAIGLVQKM